MLDQEYIEIMKIITILAEVICVSVTILGITWIVHKTTRGNI